jgi:hypothetical protein
MDETIVAARIHPGIGVARVGNSPDGYFVGPETPHPAPLPPGAYRDATGALKRQAARFRVYGYNAAGEVVRELTAAEAEITWTVAIANKKAAWYNFELAMDIPQAFAVGRRNAAYTGDERRSLEIRPRPRTVCGANCQGPAYHFDDGSFLGTHVYLGELRTDEQGRLLVLGGHGVSGTPWPANAVITFANNDGWYDDTADGPVQAAVALDGRTLPVEPAWVIVAPPNYAPDLVGIVTMYELMVDTYQGWWMEAPSTPSFQSDIYPLLARLAMTQWVNQGFLAQFGWGSPNNFLDPTYVSKLAHKVGKHDAHQELRRQLFHAFRDPQATEANALAWPWVYGDDPVDDNPPPDAFLTVTPTQHMFLRQWADGDFIEDWDPDAQPPAAVEDAPVAEQPGLLDRAALDFCLGGPFHPGCEMTWPMRHITLYTAPFRIRPRSPLTPEPDDGDQLDPKQFDHFDESSPLFASGPGDITRWMAVPWQTDTASCRAGYQPAVDPYLPSFWPARVPNHVLSAADYAVVMDTSRPRAERLAAFYRRSVWTRWLGHPQSALGQINQMISSFADLGIVEQRPGLPGDPDFPPVMYVENTPRVQPDGLLAQGVEEVPHDQGLTIMPELRLNRGRRAR